MSQILLAAITEAGQQLEYADAEVMRLGSENSLDVEALRHSIEVASNRLSRAMLFHHVLAGDVALGISPVPVTYLIDDIVVAARAILGASAIKITTAAEDADIWPMDRELVLEVFYNAILAAAGHARTEVRLSAALEEGMLVLRVNDDGPGFPSLDEDSFHERGFGLYVAQHIAALHRRGNRTGRVAVSNGGTLGGGVFAVYLP